MELGDWITYLLEGNEDSILVACVVKIALVTRWQFSF